MCKRWRKVLSFLLTVILLLCSCGSNISSEEGQATSEEIADFGIRLLQKADSGQKNALLSNVSVVCALAMAVNGAEGETKMQLEKTLGLSSEELNRFMEYYLEKIEEKENGTLHIANSIWYREDDIEIEKDFAKKAEKIYRAEVRKAEFDDSTAIEISNWVSDETKNMIPTIIDKVGEQDMMYLINALAFEGEWDEPYSKYTEGRFMKEEGESKLCDFMSGMESLYIEDENAIGFIKFYKNKEYAFVALLPVEGLSVTAYLEKLNGECLMSMVSNPTEVIVVTKMPKFEYECNTELKMILTDMGIKDLFSPSQASLAKMGTMEEDNLYIDEVIHKTFISVNLKGTKASASTRMAGYATGGISTEEVKDVILDRPFVYMLIDCDTNLPFFMGTVVDPGENPNSD